MLSPSKSFLARPRLIEHVCLIKRHAVVRAASARIDDEADAGCSTSPRANCCPIRRTTSLRASRTSTMILKRRETATKHGISFANAENWLLAHDLTDILDQRDRDYCIAVL